MNRNHGRPRDLVTIAAAVVGSAAATQVIADQMDASARHYEQHQETIKATLDALVEDMHAVPQETDAQRFAATSSALMTNPNRATTVAAAALMRLADNYEKALDDHAGLNTYVTDKPEDFTATAHGQAEVVGSNGRRLLVRRMPEGVWIGGALVSDPGALADLASFLAYEADLKLAARDA